jgi:hypothetical protein
MRSSKSRSRNKNNRNRNNNSLGNIVNRVFDSSGPEGKVRGTPQQIIDKYTQLARDAGLANDRVNMENFQQHAEHYLRMLSEAQREQDSRREQQDKENRERQAQRDRERAQRDKDQTGGQVGYQNGNGEQPAVEKPKPAEAFDPGLAPQPDVMDFDNDDDGPGLVDTPESRPKAPEPVAEPAPAEASQPAPSETAEAAADAPKPEKKTSSRAPAKSAEDKPKKPRAPRKPAGTTTPRKRTTKKADADAAPAAEAPAEKATPDAAE